VTQRPTFSELKRVLMVLGSVRPVQLQEAAGELEEAAAANAAASDKSHTTGNSKQQQKQQQQQVPAAVVNVSSIPGPSPGAAKKQVRTAQGAGWALSLWHGSSCNLSQAAAE